MSLKTGFATVLKAMRVSRGLTQKHLADTTSRTYMSKLEQGRSNPTIDKLTAISGALELCPLTLFTLTLSVESGQTVKTLMQHLEADIADLEATGALKALASARSQTSAQPEPSYPAWKGLLPHTRKLSCASLSKRKRDLRIKSLDPSKSVSLSSGGDA